MRRLNWFGFWTLLGLVSGVQLFFADQRLALHPNAWWQALATALPACYLWGLQYLEDPSRGPYVCPHLVDLVCFK